MTKIENLPNDQGRFGAFGGRFVPETLMAAIEELRVAYEAAREDPEFQAELAGLLSTYVGRPTPLTFAANLTKHFGGAKIYLKREDLAHTGAHKINHAIGQALLAKRMGKNRIIAETGAGQHGVATATVCALMGMECIVYMGTEDIRRQEPNVFRMKLMGSTVEPVESGSRTLKDAINECMRDWVTNVRTTFYLLGSVVGPHPYPMMVRDFQAIVGREAKAQLQVAEGRLPDYALACVGGGSNAIGLFHDFIPNESVALIGVEAGGHGLETGEHAAPLSAGQRFRGAGLSRRWTGTLLSEGHWPCNVRFGHRRRGAGGVLAAVSTGRDHPGVGVVPRAGPLEGAGTGGRAGQGHRREPERSRRQRPGRSDPGAGRTGSKLVNTRNNHGHRQRTDKLVQRSPLGVHLRGL